jgi:hypothetical protein
MSKRITLPPMVKSRSSLKPGKGWRLINAKRTGTLKAALVAAFKASGERYAIFRIRD